MGPIWVAAYSRVSFLPRIKVVFGKRTADGWLPLYHYPKHRYDVEVRDWNDLPELDALVARMRLLESDVDPNLVIITLYPNGAFSIDNHFDEPLDLDPSHGIIGVSDGATRVMQIRPRKDPARTHLTPTARREWDLKLSAGQWNVLKTQTNARYTHGVHKVRPPASVQWRTSSIFRRTRSFFQPQSDGSLKIRRNGHIKSYRRKLKLNSSNPLNFSLLSAVCVYVCVQPNIRLPISCTHGRRRWR